MCLLKTSLILFILLNCFLPLQAQKKDTLQPKKPKEPLQLTGIRVGFDLVPPIISFVDADFVNYEASAEILLGNKYFLSGDIGTATTKRVGENYNYTNQGSYIRLGVDNYLKTNNFKKVGGMASFGLRYGFASFQQQLTYEFADNYWGGIQNNFTDRNLTAHWLELVGNLRASIFKNLFFGPTLRLKFRMAVSKTALLDIQDIPGYGINNFARIQPGYQLIYQIPFRKAKQLDKKP